MFFVFFFIVVDHIRPFDFFWERKEMLEKYQANTSIYDKISAYITWELLDKLEIGGLFYL
ncbi:hypothetical protein JCM13304A_06510 [Desulfothermus okinawensis JCM 13304]